MSLMDKVKAIFSGGSAEHEHEHEHDHDHPHIEPTPEEIAAAAQAEPPLTTVEGLSEDEPGSGPKDEVH